MKTRWVGSGLNEKLINLENKKVIIRIIKIFSHRSKTSQRKLLQSQKKIKLETKS